MAGLATKETNKSVEGFINAVDSKSKQDDSRVLLKLIEEVTGYKPKVWGDNFIIGFGKYKYKRKQGKEEYEWFNVGFAPRKTKITIYLTFDINKEQELISKLGKCKWGKGCLYVNKLQDIDLNILRKLILKSKDATWH
ncbi:DUF1801 domain-containing protein [Winogradskyella poriferorum]|uniref:DUF1801 domain-containing protein n=1 Tax=Winogradskyella poriferorum TaxID=307627 RepID=UPI003D64C2F4